VPLLFGEYPSVVRCQEGRSHPAHRTRILLRPRITAFQARWLTPGHLWVTSQVVQWAAGGPGYLYQPRSEVGKWPCKLVELSNSVAASVDGHRHREPGIDTAAGCKVNDAIVIEAGRADRHYWSDLWRYRELFRVLAWRDLSVRYKQTVIGVLWAVIRPFLTMLVFTIIFGRIAKLPTDGDAPYALMVFAGILPWTFFATGLSEASNSLINNEKLISKVYFPRLIVPIATIVVAFVDFLISFCILLLLMAWYRYMPDWRMVFLPLYILLAFFASVGPSLWITSLNVKYRDFRYVIPFIVQFGLYVSPVGFSSSVVPEKWRLLYSFNPLVGVIDGFRWCILGGRTELYLPGLLASAAVTAFFLWFGLRQFRKTERTFADLI
jgi:lipopolysaccharide transport system permease protein